MKQAGNFETNQILFIGRVKLIASDQKKIQIVSKIDRILIIDLNGGQLYYCSDAMVGTNALGNLNRDKVSIQTLQNPISSFPILPQNQVYQLSPNQSGIEQYFSKLGVFRDKNQVVCLYCNNKNNYMFPLLFQSRNICIAFHKAVLIYQMYHQYYKEFIKYKQSKNVQTSMNMRLLQLIAHSVTTQDFTIDPQVLSTIQMQQFQLKILKQQILKFSTQNMRRSQSNNRISASNANIHMNQAHSKFSLFSLRLRYNIVDSISLQYLRTLVSEEIMKKNVVELDVSGCSVTDQMLDRILLNKSVGKNAINTFVLSTTSQLFQNLIKLDLSKNDLTDLCFIPLAEFVGYTPKLSDICLNGNKIKLLPISQYPKQQKMRIKKSKTNLFRWSSIPSPRSLKPKTEPPSPPSSPRIAPHPQQQPFIQFLLSLKYMPLNYLSLQNNHIQQTQLIVQYIIQAQNVPLKYMCLKGNRIKELDKIRMAKLIIGEIRERGDQESLVVLDFGPISVVDQQVYQYLILLKQKNQHIDINRTNDTNAVLKQLKKQDQLQQSRRFSKLLASFTSQDLKRSQSMLQRSSTGKSHTNTMRVCLTSNKQWQVCDQSAIMDVSNLFRNRRRKTSQRSQMIQNMLIGGALTPSNSQSSLKVQSKNFQTALSFQTLKPAVKYLKQAYIASNYSAIRFYKQQLKQYNQQLYNRKIAPLFVKYQKQIKKQQQKLISDIQNFINLYQTQSNQESSANILQGFAQERQVQNQNEGENQIQVKNIPRKKNSYGDNLNLLISKLFRKRIEYHINQTIVLYEGTEQEEEISGKKYGSNVFAFLLYLKHKRDQLIEKFISQKKNPYDEIYTRLALCNNLYQGYYIKMNSWVCEDDYATILSSYISKHQSKQNNPNNAENPIPEQSQQSQLNQKISQRQLHNLIKQKYLKKCKNNSSNHVYNIKYLQISQQERNLCLIEPKLVSTGILIKFYTYVRIDGNNKDKEQKDVDKQDVIVLKKGLLNRIKCNLSVSHVKMGQPISIGITNYLQYLSKYDLLVNSSQCHCINPNIPCQALPNYSSLKLAIYNPYYQQYLTKFSELVIAFLKFLYHSPRQMLPQTLQYLSYLINIVLSEEDSYNVECLATEFYLQLLTFNVRQQVGSRVQQLDVGILEAVVEFCGIYMPYIESLENYIKAHVIRVQIAAKYMGMSKVSRCRLLARNAQRYNRRQDQLPPAILAQLFGNIQPPNPSSSLPSASPLTIPVQLYYYNYKMSELINQSQQQLIKDRLSTNYLQNQLELSKFVVNLHILATVEELIEAVWASQVGRQVVAQWCWGTQAQGHGSRNTNWSVFLYNRENHKIQLMLPSSNQITSIYSLLRDGIITPTPTKYLLLLKQLLPPLQPPMSSSSYTETRPTNLSLLPRPNPSPASSIEYNINLMQLYELFRHVYRGFRLNGASLSMIKIDGQIVHLVDLILQCLVCQVMFVSRDRLGKLLEVGTTPGQLKQELSSIMEAYYQNFQYYCPVGTASTLSHQQKKHIQQQSIKKIAQILLSISPSLSSNPAQSNTKAYQVALLQQIDRLHRMCKLITNCTVIVDRYGQQEAVFTPHGIIKISKIIYVEGFEWRHLWDVKFIQQVSQDGARWVSSIELWFMEGIAKEGNIAKVDKLVLNSNINNKDSIIFINSCMLMLKNIAYTYLQSPNKTLYKYWSKQLGPKDLLKKLQQVPKNNSTGSLKLSNVSRNQQGQISQKTKKLIKNSIWKELISEIQYVEAPKKTIKSLEEIKEYPVRSFDQTFTNTDSYNVYNYKNRRDALNKQQQQINPVTENTPQININKPNIQINNLGNKNYNIEDRIEEKSSEMEQSSKKELSKNPTEKNGLNIDESGQRNMKKIQSSKQDIQIDNIINQMEQSKSYEDSIRQSQQTSKDNVNQRSSIAQSSMDKQKEPELDKNAEIQQIVVTNARKSGRRELPKRRSSREK